MNDQTFYQDFYSRTDWKQNKLIITLGTRAYLNIFTGLLQRNYSNFCDVGCGTGRFTKILSQFGYSIKGFDFSGKAIERAKKAFPELDFSCQDATDLKYTEKFDVFFVNGFSLFNTLDFTLVKDTIAYWSQFLNNNGAIFCISKTDFSGKIKSGWHYHTKAQVDEMFHIDGFSTQVHYIHSSLKYICLLPFTRFCLKLAEIVSDKLFNKLLKLPLRSLIILTKND